MINILSPPTISSLRFSSCPPSSHSRVWIQSTHSRYGFPLYVYLFDLSLSTLPRPLRSEYLKSGFLSLLIFLPAQVCNYSTIFFPLAVLLVLLDPRTHSHITDASRVLARTPLKNFVYPVFCHQDISSWLAHMLIPGTVMRIYMNIYVYIFTSIYVAVYM